MVATEEIRRSVDTPAGELVVWVEWEKGSPEHECQQYVERSVLSEVIWRCEEKIACLDPGKTCCGEYGDDDLKARLMAFVAEQKEQLCRL